MTHLLRDRCEYAHDACTCRPLTDPVHARRLHRLVESRHLRAVELARVSDAINRARRAA